MSESQAEPRPELEPASTPTEKPHPIQRLMDNPWLLLVLCLLIMSVSYTLWGWWEIANVEPARLP